MRKEGRGCCLPLLDSTVRLDVNDIADPVESLLAIVVVWRSREFSRS